MRCGAASMRRCIRRPRDHEAILIQDRRLVHREVPVVGGLPPAGGNVAPGEPDQLGRRLVLGEVPASLDDLSAASHAHSPTHWSCRSRDGSPAERRRRDSRATRRGARTRPPCETARPTAPARRRPVRRPPRRRWTPCRPAAAQRRAASVPANWRRRDCAAVVSGASPRQGHSPGGASTRRQASAPPAPS